MRAHLTGLKALYFVIAAGLTVTDLSFAMQRIARSRHNRAGALTDMPPKPQSHRTGVARFTLVMCLWRDMLCPRQVSTGLIKSSTASIRLFPDVG